MNLVSTTTICDADRIYNDVQFWSDLDNSMIIVGSCEFISYIDCNKLPIFLIDGKSLLIFSNDPQTEIFFKQKLLQITSNADFRHGLLTKIGEEKYVVFYYETQVRCLVLDFSKLKYTRDFLEEDKTLENSFVKPKRKSTTTSSPAVTAFDRVLKEKQEGNPFLRTQPKPNKSLVLSTQEQISTAVNKIIQSGLRIRGLSMNQTESINDKLKIKEIYQMTHKATMFSLSKFNYSFNKRTDSEKVQVSWNDIQETVESLLHLFIDLD